MITRIKSSRAWLFVANGENRAVLRFVGAGAAAVIGCGWYLFVSCSNPGQRSQQPVTAINGGVAAGGNISGNINVNVNVGPSEKQVREAVSDEQRPIADGIAQMEAFCKETIASLKLGGNDPSSVADNKSERTLAAAAAVATAIGVPSAIVSDALLHAPGMLGTAAIDPLGTGALFHIADISMASDNTFHVPDLLGVSSKGVVPDALLHPPAVFGAAAIDPLHPFGNRGAIDTAATFHVADISTVVDSTIHVPDVFGVSANGVVGDALLHPAGMLGTAATDPLGTGALFHGANFSVADGNSGTAATNPPGTGALFHGADFSVTAGNTGAAATDPLGTGALFHVADFSTISDTTLHAPDVFGVSANGVVGDALLHPPAMFGAAATDPLRPFGTSDTFGVSPTGVVVDAVPHPPAIFGAGARSDSILLR